ncbi:multifunctional CCA protein [Aeromonas phage Ah1]|uniref:Multifunctional CCA protein n=1 Tax=Aeromonas phage Ah1 TaxID=2053701 RepID=A0A2H4YF77_9CAUD|nr:tRNA nucleotidyltransferase [Aeromonas phage Ah1]AUE22829.1 multifunctional CCA protein [Aeromonas phage Ah1]
MNIYLVGGAVRDMVMNRQPKDRDYVIVGSTHDEMIAKGYKQVGADFPVYLDDLGQEYALARTERSTGKGYNDFVTDFNPNVTLEQDLLRRDFTMNAMALGMNGVLVDPYNGQQDIKDRVVNVVNPQAFHEDPVRVLRACRFAARYDFRLSTLTLECILRCIKDGRMDHLTSERIWLEFEKSFGKNMSDFLMNMHCTGAFKALGIHAGWTIHRHGNGAPVEQFAAIAYDMNTEQLAKFYSVVKVPSEFKKFADIVKNSLQDTALNVRLYTALNATRNKFREEIKNYFVDENQVSKEKFESAEKAFDSVVASAYSEQGKELGRAMMCDRINRIADALVK